MSNVTPIPTAKMLSPRHPVFSGDSGPAKTAPTPRHPDQRQLAFQPPRGMEWGEIMHETRDYQQPAKPQRRARPWQTRQNR